MAPVGVKQPWRMWLNRSHKSINLWYNHNLTSHCKVCYILYTASLGITREKTIDIGVTEQCNQRPQRHLSDQHPRFMCISEKPRGISMPFLFYESVYRYKVHFVEGTCASKPITILYIIYKNIQYIILLNSNTDIGILTPNNQRIHTIRNASISQINYS